MEGKFSSCDFFYFFFISEIIGTQGNAAMRHRSYIGGLAFNTSRRQDGESVNKVNNQKSL